MSLSVRLSVCLYTYLRNHTSAFHQIFYDRLLPVAWSSSVFVYFCLVWLSSYNGPYGSFMLPLLTPLLHGIGCALS